MDIFLEQLRFLGGAIKHTQTHTRGENGIFHCILFGIRNPCFFWQRCRIETAVKSIKKWHFCSSWTLKLNDVFTHGVFVSREVLVLPQITKKSMISVVFNLLITFSHDPSGSDIGSMTFYVLRCESWLRRFPSGLQHALIRERRPIQLIVKKNNPRGCIYINGWPVVRDGTLTKSADVFKILSFDHFKK